MAKSTPPTVSELEKHAASIRDELKVPKQSEVFRCAVEAGYLAALADGDVDDTELETIVKAVEVLSVGAVIEWEADSLLEECIERAKTEGAKARADAVGAELKALGHAEAALLFAATVARATKGIDKTEAAVLKAIGAAAGVSTDKVRAIVKRAAFAG